MSETFKQICHLVHINSVRLSEHGYNELIADNIFARDVIGTVQEGVVVEDYPEYPKGPCVLVLQKDSENQRVCMGMIHVLLHQLMQV